MKLRDEGIRALGIQRKSGEYLGCPRGETEIYSGDTLILYGRVSMLETLDERSKGIRGDQSHDNAVDEQQEFLDKQDYKKGGKEVENE